MGEFFLLSDGITTTNLVWRWRITGQFHHLNWAYWSDLTGTNSDAASTRVNFIAAISSVLSMTAVNSVRNHVGCLPSQRDSWFDRPLWVKSSPSTAEDQRGRNTNCHFGRSAHDTFSLFLLRHESRSVASSQGLSCSGFLRSFSNQRGVIGPTPPPL